MKSLHQIIHHLTLLLLCLTLPTKANNLLKHSHHLSKKIHKPEKCKHQRKINKQKILLGGLIFLGLALGTKKAIRYYRQQPFSTTITKIDSLLKLTNTLTADHQGKRELIEYQQLLKIIQNNINTPDKQQQVKQLASTIEVSSKNFYTLYQKLANNYCIEYPILAFKALCSIQVEGECLINKKNINKKYGDEKNTILHLLYNTLVEDIKHPVKSGSSTILKASMAFMLEHKADPKQQNSQGVSVWHELQDDKFILSTSGEYITTLNIASSTNDEQDTYRIYFKYKHKTTGQEHTINIMS